MKTNTFTPLQEKWLKELESGRHKQCKEKLKTTEGHCCLGIAEEFVFCIQPILNVYDNFTFGGRTLDLGCEHAKALNFWDVNEDDSSSWEGKINEEYMKTFLNIMVAQGYVFNRHWAPTTLTVYNDSGATFQQIAYAIRKCPQAVFTNFDENYKPN